MSRGSEMTSAPSSWSGARSPLDLQDQVVLELQGDTDDGATRHETKGTSSEPFGARRRAEWGQVTQSTRRWSDVFGLSRVAVAVGVAGIAAAGVVMGIAGAQTREIRARDRADAAERVRADTRGRWARCISGSRCWPAASPPSWRRTEPPRVPPRSESARWPSAARPRPSSAIPTWPRSSGRPTWPGARTPARPDDLRSRPPAVRRLPVAPSTIPCCARGGRRYLGLDLAAPGPLATALTAAVRTREPQLSPPARLHLRRPGVLLVEPVFGDAGDSRGVVVGVLDLPGFGARALYRSPRRARRSWRSPPTAAHDHLPARRVA